MFQVKGTKKEFIISGAIPTLVDVCEDGTVICDRNMGDNKLCFVDVENQKLTEVKRKIPPVAHVFVDTQKKAIWSWDEISDELWRHTLAGSEKKGHLKSGRGTSFLHVDSADRLYFVDIPF